MKLLSRYGQSNSFTFVKDLIGYLVFTVCIALMLKEHEFSVGFESESSLVLQQLNKKE